jgi:hypothetical protein
MANRQKFTADQKKQIKMVLFVFITVYHIVLRDETYK